MSDSRRETNPLLAETHVAELATLVDRLKPLAIDETPIVSDTSLGMRVALTTADGISFHLSVSHPDHDAAQAAHTLGGDEIARARGVTHFWLAAQSMDVRQPELPTSRLASAQRVGKELQQAGNNDLKTYFDARPSR